MARITAPFIWTMIILHHSSRDTDTTSGLRKWALKNGYDDIAYHFVIDQYGGLHYGRALTRQGCHGNKAANEHGIGIAMIGNFNKHEPSILQVASTVRLCVLLCITHRIRPQNIFGHKEVRNKQTSCPGDKFPLKAFKSAVINDFKEVYADCGLCLVPF